MSKANSSPSASKSPQNPKSPATGVPVSFRNPFEEGDPEQVWQQLLSNMGPPISREEAIRRMIEGAKEKDSKSE